MFNEVSYEVSIDTEVSMLKQFVSMYLPPPLTLIHEYGGQLHQLAQIQVTAVISVSHPELVLLPLWCQLPPP